MKRQTVDPERDVQQRTTDAEPETLIDSLLEVSVRSPPPRTIDGVVIGTLVGITPSGEPLVDFPQSQSKEGIVARTMIAPEPAQIGRRVAILFEGGQSSRPVLMGLMAQINVPVATPTAEADGERLEFQASKEIVFRCGDASITLTRAGKILIKGAYVLSRSSGVNRILGGTVEIN